MHRFKTIFYSLVVLAMMPLLAHAQIPDPVSFSVTQAPQKISTGDAFEVVITADIKGNWHLYSINVPDDAGPFPTELTIPGKAWAVNGTITESDPTIEYDPNFKTKLGWHSHEATFTIPVKLSKKPSSKLTVDILYQVCNDRVCMPPKTKSIVVPTNVEGVTLTASNSLKVDDTALAEVKKKDEPSTSQSGEATVSASKSSVGGGGIFSFLWIAILAGFAALLTPCVFPMIPLTVSYFSKQDDSGRGVGQALGFGASIIVTFTILGALLALFIGAAGALEFASNPWVNLFIGGILIVFALSLLGGFELRLPYQVTNYLNKKSNEGSGVTGIIFMALTISAVSFSCTAPFVGGVLAATAGGQWFYPILGMVGFSAAFASPFVLFALFPDWLESLPKSGSWMNIVKVLLGFIELAAAFKFLSNADLVWGFFLISRPFVIAAWIAIFLLAALYVLGVYSMKHEEKPKKIGTGRLVLAIPLLLFCFYLIPGLMGASLGIWDAWLPPKQATDVSVVSSIVMSGETVENEHEAWSGNYQASIGRAKEVAQPVFIDFTGYTCTNCRAMEANVFPTAAVQKRFANMELVRLYTDGGENASQNRQLQFELTGTVALPTYVIINPYTEQIIAQQLGYTEQETFVNFLEMGLNKFNKLNS